MQLQTKIVLAVSAGLIILGTSAMLLFERYAAGPNPGEAHQHIDVGALSAPSRLVLIMLMFIGGSPGSTAGGIKTVTLAVVIMTVVAALRRRQEVEMFRRSVRIVVVGRAITVTLLFVAALFGATLALSVTENAGGFTRWDYPP
ncbi:MAG: potassium transporter TrkG [Planctomycetota bacterium]|jgi:trk system potassium uptake protein TrkH